MNNTPNYIATLFAEQYKDLEPYQTRGIPNLREIKRVYRKDPYVAFRNLHLMVNAVVLQAGEAPLVEGLSALTRQALELRQSSKRLTLSPPDLCCLEAEPRLIRSLDYHENTAPTEKTYPAMILRDRHGEPFAYRKSSGYAR